MTPQLEAALLCAILAVLFVALQMLFTLQMGIAGVFVMGMAGGLVIGDSITRAASRKAAA